MTMNMTIASNAIRSLWHQSILDPMMPGSPELKWAIQNVELPVCQRISNSLSLPGRIVSNHVGEQLSLEPDGLELDRI